MQTFNQEGFSEYSSGGGLESDTFKEISKYPFVPEPVVINENLKNEWVDLSVLHGASKEMVTALAEGVTRVSHEEFKNSSIEMAKKISKEVGDQKFAHCGR